MNKSFFYLLFILISACATVKKTLNPLQYDQFPIYLGEDLGIVITDKDVSFKVWSPTAEAVKMNIYRRGDGSTPLETIVLKKVPQGIWKTNLSKDYIGKYYTIQVQIAGNYLPETPDPYAKAAGVNGKRAQILDIANTNPDFWEKDTKPPLAAPTDIILYELHVRDLSSHSSSGIRNKGKFIGLAEKGTRSPSGLATGLDHIKELGITHVHLLPSYDFTTVDESKPNVPQFNWGYDPLNYNIPEGSYSTNAADGATRIVEFKQMVQALHTNGIRVVMDVVYNHTMFNDESVFSRTVPGYYYRHTEDGKYSNASGCGNETASERPMVRKYIVESVKYWAKEYHIDGFRFDLMGIHDLETMNLVSAELKKIDPSIYVYGEGWTSGSSPLPDNQRALKANVPKLEVIAAFSDDMRDALKGSVFDAKDRGFVSGKPGMEESIKFGIVASTQHPQVDYAKVNYSKAPWAKEPYQAITYAECHDNHTLWDRLVNSCPEASDAERVKMHKLAGAMILTSQGVSFLHAGMEMMRTKGGEENSFNKGDEVNQFQWERKKQYQEAFLYYRSLVQLRKNHPAFRMKTTAEIQKNLHFWKAQDNIIIYQLTDENDTWKNIVVIFNGNSKGQKVLIPDGNWKVVANGESINEQGLSRSSGGDLEIAGTSMMVLVWEDEKSGKY
jgi:pullulanase